MTFETEDYINVVRVIMTGKIVASVAADIKATLEQQLQVKKNLVLDFTQVTDIDSTGLGALVYLLHKAKSMDGNIKLACIQPRPRIVFDVTKVYRVFDIFDSVDAALDSFNE